MLARCILHAVATIGVRSRLSLLTLIAILPLFSQLTVGATRFRDFAREAAGNRVLAMARLGAERQSEALAQARAVLSVLRHLSQIAVADPEACHATLRALARENPQFAEIGLVDADGGITCLSAAGLPQRFGDAELFRRAALSDSSTLVLGKLVIGPTTAKALVTAALPIASSSGEGPRGIAYASLDLDRAARHALDFADTTDAATLSLIDIRTATILLHAPDKPLVVGTKLPRGPLLEAMRAEPGGGNVEAADSDGTPMIFGFAPLRPDMPGMMVAVGLPSPVALADVRERVVIGISIAALAALTAAGAAWLFGDRTQSRPIRALVETARELGAGNLAARARLANWQAPEFRTLDATLGEMADNIAKTQARLAESQRQLRLLADHATDMVFQLDGGLVLCYVSPASRDILGYDPEEASGQSALAFVHGDDAASFAGVLAALLAGRYERASTVLRVGHRDERWLWAEVQLRAVAEPPGSPVVIIGALRDISVRKVAEDRLADAYRRLEILAGQDGLTGLANRRTFDDLLMREYRRARRERTKLALVMLDVDRFKSFNDRYGHPAGDECLKRVGQAIGAALHRPGDVAARYGGEEFAVLLPATDAAGGAAIAEIIRSAVLNLAIEHEASPTRAVTISAGVAAFTPADPDRDAAGLVEDADRCLYLAKGRGRNTIVVAGEGEAHDAPAKRQLRSA